jgi:hypothetical protein
MASTQPRPGAGSSQPDRENAIALNLQDLEQIFKRWIFALYG